MADENRTKRKRVIIIAAFGDRKANVTRLVHNIRSFVDYPIIIVTTYDSKVGAPCHFGGVTRRYVDRKYATGHPRDGVRNSNYHKICEALSLDVWAEYSSALLLDDDMLIMNKNFVDGYEIAERFGAALPLNPRTFQLYNLMGADVTDQDYSELYDTPLFAPAHNFSPMFVDVRDERSMKWMQEIQRILNQRVCRGTLAIWKAMWNTGFTPVNLPMQWCVCGAEAGAMKHYTQVLNGQNLSIPVMMLHLGHVLTRKVFRTEIDDVTQGQ